MVEVTDKSLQAIEAQRAKLWPNQGKRTRQHTCVMTGTLRNVMYYHNLPVRPCLNTHLSPPPPNRRRSAPVAVRSGAEPLTPHPQPALTLKFQ